MHTLEHDVIETVDVRAVLAAVLALHDAVDVDALVKRLPRLIADLVPSDSMDLIGRPGPRASGPGPGEDHRLVVRITGAEPVLSGIVLGRHRAFTLRERTTAELIGRHLVAAVDHVRLRDAQRRGASRARPLAALTSREQQVLALVAEGARDRDIAATLRIEPRTVEKHVEHIRSKLGARSRAEAAARWARAAG